MTKKAILGLFALGYVNLGFYTILAWYREEAEKTSPNLILSTKV